MGSIQLVGVRKEFGGVKVINGVDLMIPDGSFTVFVGPSGCGKSTLLRLIAGLEDVSSGQVLIDGQDMTHIGPAKRGLAMVFQSYALYPHMSVRSNIAFALKMAGEGADVIEQKVRKAAATLNLTDYLDRKPRQLSGGQRQRVAIGRAIVRHPKLFLFDEPLSNLDAELRTQMRVEIAKLHRDLGATMVYVTHDQIEAMTLADRIVVLRAGKVEQIGTPTELYDRPANMFVAGFIGSPKMNFIPANVASVDGRTARVAHPAFVGGDVHVTLHGGRPVAAGDAVTIGLRPEHLSLGGAMPLLSVTVDFAENLGGSTQIYATAPDSPTITVMAGGRPAVSPGEALPVSLGSGHIYAFDAAGAAL